MNDLKDLLKTGKAVIGTTATPAMDVPTLANSGFDFLLFLIIDRAGKSNVFGGFKLVVSAGISDCTRGRG